MKVILVVILVLSGATWVQGQGAMNVWRFGEGAGVVFNGGLATGSVALSSQFFSDRGCASVSGSGGQLLFSTDGYWVFDRYDQRMPSFSGMSPFSPIMQWAGVAAVQSAVIVPFKADTNRFYVFSLTTLGQLYYSVVDMALNGGLGDIVAGQKSVLLDYGLTGKMAATAGCDHIWLVARSKHANTYRAYAITGAGVNTSPVISICGNMAVSCYQDGALRFSADGSRMAAANMKIASTAAVPALVGGLEVYDFDRFSGTVSNAVALDTQKAMYGVCFSGDGSKLYCSATDERAVYQYDLSLGAPASIISSGTAVLRNPTYWVMDESCGCWKPDTPALGELQRGPDGRIYISNNTTEHAVITVNGYSFQSHFLHAIHFPNLAGAACGPQTDAVNTSRWTRMGLPNDVVSWPIQDTVVQTKFVRVCFGDSVRLKADSGRNYIWDNGATGGDRLAAGSGIYWVWYTDSNCSHRIDSFRAEFVRMPMVSAFAYSCPGGTAGKLWIASAPGDTGSFRYVWEDGLGHVVKTTPFTRSDTAARLDTGWYRVHFYRAGGCDSFLDLRVEPLPVPDAGFETDSVVCVGDTVVFTNLSDAPVYRWWFEDGETSGERDPDHVYSTTGRFRAVLSVSNMEGCHDTAWSHIEVKEFELELRASKQFPDPDEPVLIQSSSSEDYEILKWSPAGLFPDQHVRSSYVVPGASMEITAWGVSEYGCIDSTSLTVVVRPVVFLPSVFSPNGDGRNDLFHPLVTGPGLRVQLFEVFDRWGAMIWRAGSNDPAEGWDGSYGGVPAAVGTYFYQFRGEVPGGKVIVLKGDVMVVR